MTDNRDKLFPLAAPADEQLGNILANGLKEVDPGECPSAEEMAALLEGKIPYEKRDKIMKHLSSCDMCSEIFFLSADLHGETETKIEIQTGVRKERSHIFIFRPLALAASILIVIISLYLFFRTGVPKTTEQLLDMEAKPHQEKVIPSQPTVTPPESDFKLKEDRKAKLSPPSPGSSMPKAKKGVPAESAVDRFTGSGAEKPTGKVYSQKTHLKKAEEEEKTTGSPAAAPIAPPVEKTGEKLLNTAEDRERQSTKSRGRAAVLEKRAEEPAEPSPKKMEAVSAAAAPVEKETIAEKQEKKTVLADETTARKDKGLSASASPLERNMTWSQANLLNQQSQVYKAHIPANELQDMFKQAMDYSRQLQEPFEKIKNETTASGDVKKIETFVQGVYPLITIKARKDAYYIYPNIGYFLSKCVPGSLEFQFFNLARLGWCKPGVGCFEMEEASRVYTNRRTESAGEREQSQAQLMQWKALSPRLNGVFKEIAASTIGYLENSAQQRVPAKEK